MTAEINKLSLRAFYEKNKEDYTGGDPVMKQRSGMSSINGILLKRPVVNYQTIRLLRKTLSLTL